MFIDEAVDEGSSSAPPDFEPPRDAARAADLHHADKGKGVETPDPQLERSKRQREAAEVTESKVQEEEEYGPKKLICTRQTKGRVWKRETHSWKKVRGSLKRRGDRKQGEGRVGGIASRHVTGSDAWRWF